jgi:hypothetical protein
MIVNIGESPANLEQDMKLAGECLLLADSVEKVAPLAGLRQNLCIGRRGITQHDGTVIEWAGATVLLIQP